jgi:CBS domain-containing protein
MESNATEKLFQKKRISEIISPRLIQAPSKTTVEEALDVMTREQSAYIVVADGDRVVGMFTETDVVQKILYKNIDRARPIRDFMTPNPLSLRPDDPVVHAIDLMAAHGFYHIPLVDEGQKLVGVLSVRTLIRFLAEFYPGEVYNFPPDVHQVAQTAEGG